MKIAFIYAGQGSQFSKMGIDLYQDEPVFSHAIDKIDKDGRIKLITYSGTIEELSQTQNTQPCMVLFAIALTKTLEHYGVKPDMLAGLSLGEYSALYASGVLTDAQAVELVSFRGKEMAKISKEISCSMSAILGLKRELVEKSVSRASEVGNVYIANYNSPSQIVISGDEKAVAKAEELATEYGAKRVVRLNVSGPFHTKYMKPVGDLLKKRFESEEFSDMQIPVVFNAIGREMKKDENIKDLLEKQVQSSVYFEDSINYMIKNGVDTFIEIGGGKVLSGFVKKISKDVNVYNVDNCESLKEVIKKIKGD